MFETNKKLELSIKIKDLHETAGVLDSRAHKLKKEKIQEPRFFFQQFKASDKAC